MLVNIQITINLRIRLLVLEKIWITEQYVLPSKVSSKPRIFNCENCNKSYVYKRDLIRHQKQECGVAPQFHCPYCRHSSHRKCNLKVHIQMKHHRPA